MQSFTYADHRYEIITNLMSWLDAKTYAESIGGYLAMVTSEEENNAILANALNFKNESPSVEDGGGARYVWIGASDILLEGTWTWVDGSDVSGYSKWGSGIYGSEPDNFNDAQDAMAIGLESWPQPTGGIGSAGEWNDINQNNLLISIVEFDANRTPTITSGSIGTIAENATISTVIYDADATDPDNDAITYSLSGVDIASLNIDSSTGQVTLKTSADYETQNSYRFNVIASDGTLSDSKAVLVSVTDVDESGDTGIGSDTNTDSDNVLTTAGNDTLTGTTDNDTLSYESAPKGVKVNLSITTPQKTGGSGTDTIGGFENLTGSAYNDLLTGNEGNNLLDGGAGADKMAGGLGDDTYYVDHPKDKVTEKINEGTDTIHTSISITKAVNEVENFIAEGSESIDILGNSLDNTLTGNGGANLLDGGLGNDTLFGGEGEDTFSFSSRPGSANIDTIADFTSGEDTILLSKKIFTAFKKGFSEGNLVNSAGMITEKKGYLIYDPQNGQLYYDADGTGAKTALHVALIGNHPELDVNDFTVG